MAGKGFESLEHMADVKFKVVGISLAQVFEHAASAFSSYVASGAKVSSTRKKVITVKGTDSESLMYAFLDELIYLLDAENFVVAKAKVSVSDTVLKAVLSGTSTKNLHLNHVKAATYAEMYIKKLPSKKESWEAQFVLDV